MNITFHTEDGIITYYNEENEIVAQLPVGSPLIYCLENGLAQEGVTLIELTTGEQKVLS